MNRLMAKKLEMAARVQEFQAAHPYSDRNQIPVAAQFAERLAEAQSLFVSEHAERLAASTAARRRHEVRRGLETHAMQNLVRIGVFALRQDAQAVRSFTAPAASKSNAAFVRHATALLEVGREHQEVLAGGGLPRGTLSELAAGLTEFRAAEARAQTSRRRLRETRVALDAAMVDLGRLLGVLDVYNRSRFREDAGLLTTWIDLRAVGRVGSRRRGSDIAGAAPSAPPAVAPPPSGTTPPAVAPNQSAPHAAQSGNQDPPRDGGQTRVA